MTFQIRDVEYDPDRSKKLTSFPLTPRQLKQKFQDLSLSLSGLMAIFQVDLGQPIPERLHSGFIAAKNDGSGGNNRIYNSCKDPVKSSPPTNLHPTFLQAGCPSCCPTNGVKALKGKKFPSIIILKVIRLSLTHTHTHTHTP